MYNYYRERWLIDRLAGTVATTFGHAPCVDTFDDAQAVITIGMTSRGPALRNDLDAGSRDGVISPATDNTPFLYFKGGTFPALYLLTLLAVLLTSLVAVRTLGGPLREMRPYADLFFMGAAFLLLETKNVATFALLFGTTWFVNALVFAGVLVIVLAAVETTRKFRTPSLPVVYAGIAASLALAWVIRPGVAAASPLRAHGCWLRPCWRSCRSTLRTWPSRSASRTRRTRSRHLRSTCWARSSAVVWNMPR